MVDITIFSREAMWKSNSRWPTEDLIWKSDILSEENLKFLTTSFQYINMEKHCFQCNGMFEKSVEGNPRNRNILPFTS